MGNNGFRRHLLEIKLQATRQDRYRYFLRIGRGKNEFDVGRRLFERFQHSVERMPSQHMDFVDHVDFESAAAWRVYRLLEQLCHFLDAAI